MVARTGLHIGEAPKQSKELVTVEAIVKEHWAKYGRNFYTRYDYEGVDTSKADAVMSTLVRKMGEITQACQHLYQHTRLQIQACGRGMAPVWLGHWNLATCRLLPGQLVYMINWAERRIR